MAVVRTVTKRKQCLPLKKKWDQREGKKGSVRTRVIVQRVLHLADPRFDP